jgi:transcriptional regulator with XRE-family HTH domain
MSAQSVVTEEIRVLMARRRVTQADLGEALGMKQATFSKRMTARKEWSVSELEAIAAFFDVPITDLFSTTDLRNRETRCISDSPDGAVSVPLVPAA